MSIKREDLSHSDFSDIETGEAIAPVHPGEILRLDFMAPHRLSANALAIALRVPAPRINDVVRGRRAISPETALRLARFFGTTPQFWANLQSGYDLRIAQQKAGDRIEREIEPLAA
ncbi:HigA family addiction module antitoxin [Cupriavidus campinensis]